MLFRSADGLSWAHPLATMGEAFSRVADNDRVFFIGNIREQLLAPLGVQGVKLIGAAGGRTRHDDGARWYEPASATADTPLLTLREQGWEVHNVLMVPSADAVTCIRVRRAEDAVYPDGSHAIIRGVKFMGNDETPVGAGVEDHGGAHHVLVEGCEFHGLTDAIKHTSGAGIAAPLRWLIRGNFFESNTNHLTLPGNACRVVGNIFDEATVNVDTSAGTAGGNFVLDNWFSNAEADISNSDGYTAHASDFWRNWSMNTAAQTVGVPGA